MAKYKIYKQLRFGIILAITMLVFGIHSTSALSSQTNLSAARGSTKDVAQNTGPFGAAIFDEVPPGYSHTLFDVKFLII